MKKRWIRLLAGLMLGIMPLLAGIKMLVTDINVNLKMAERITGVIAEKGIADKRSVIGGKVSVNSKVFYFRLHSSPDIFAVYRGGEHYTHYDTQLHVDDTVTIYYRSNDARLNLNVYQVEKSDRVIVDYASYDASHHTAAALAICSGIVMLALVVIGYRKRWG